MYSVPAQTNQTELIVKKSRFIARAANAATREEAMALLASCKTEHSDAGHHCWAYVTGDPESPTGAAMSDDGEPSGTAGKPILNVLQHKNIGDVMLVVTRYFGGIKLGAGGLVRAYSAAATEVMQNLKTKIFVELQTLTIETDFAQEQSLRHWLNQHNGKLLQTRYADSPCFDIALPQHETESLKGTAKQYGWKLFSSESK